jgi:hypothetical protein
MLEMNDEKYIDWEFFGLTILILFGAIPFATLLWMFTLVGE